MDPVLKSKWLEALRSGDYQQTTGVLIDVDKGVDYFCCLGVLCTVAEMERKELAGSWLFVSGDTLLGISLEEQELERFGISDEQQGTLINLNDTHNKTFPEIADWIEANL